MKWIDGDIYAQLNIFCQFTIQIKGSVYPNPEFKQIVCISIGKYIDIMHILDEP